MNIQEIYSLFKDSSGISTDTRKIKRNSMFFSLKGNNFNGNHYSKKAIENGCSYAIVDEKEYAIYRNTILVDNALETLQNLAQYHRSKLSIPIIGITGTNGKTTSKEIINFILNSEKKCYSTKGNLNNHIGVPLSILEINQTHNIAIIEMGANHIKEISFLCDIVKPSHGIITNIGIAHLEGFGSFNKIIETKNEIYKYIKENNGLIFINSEDKLLSKLSSKIEKKSYGEKGDIIGTIKNSTPFLQIEYNNFIIKSKLIGSFQFSNIMLGICVGKYFNISDYNIKNSIEQYIPNNNRSEIIKTKENTLIMDAYNANPSSMEKMLISFSEHEYKNKLCIIGEMLELGNKSKEEHQKIVELCLTLKLTTYYIGKEFKQTNKNTFKNRTEFEHLLRKRKISNKTILLKGSRSNALEKLVKYL